MDFKSLLNQLSQLSEATKETDKGRIHKADAGGYGRKFDTDEEGDEKKKDAPKEPAAKRGRGRPKKGSDESGEVKKYDNAQNLQSWIVGNLPGGKLPGKPGKKHSLKDWVEQVENNKLAETAPGQQLTVKPMPGAAQLVDPASNKVMATGDAAAIKNIQGAVGQGKVQMRADQEMAEDSVDYSAKKARAGKDIGKPGKNFSKIAKDAASRYGSKEKGQKVAGAILAKLRGKVSEADIPSASGVDTTGAGLGAGRSATTLEGKKAKPDFLDIDKDGNKKESMKKAASDKKAVKEGEEDRKQNSLWKQITDYEKRAKATKDPIKKDHFMKMASELRGKLKTNDPVNESRLNENASRHSAARFLGKSHALAKEGYNCKFDDIEEARSYHEGFKEGLDECYGQGAFALENAIPATIGGMADQTLDSDMDEGNAFTGALAKTPAGGKFSLGGKSFTDSSGYDATFESLDRQLSALLEGNVAEGMTVSISKGQQGSPDSVTVSAQDSEADQLLSIIKQSGLGLFGDDQVNGYGAPEGSEMVKQHDGIDVIDDNNGMMALIKKVSGADEEPSGEEDYSDETCSDCGQESCQCDHEEGGEEEVVDEVESYDQEEEEVAETNAPDSDAAETTADEESEATEDEALAQSDEEQVTEWANDAGEGAKDFEDESFTTDMDFITKVISGGLNKPKSTGQTTVPVIAGQDQRTMSESLTDWKRLAGL